MNLNKYLRLLTVTWMWRMWIVFEVKTVSWVQWSVTTQPLIPKAIRNIEVTGDLGWDAFQQPAVGCAYSAAIWLALSPSTLPWQYKEEAFLALYLVGGWDIASCSYMQMLVNVTSLPQWSNSRNSVQHWCIQFRSCDFYFFFPAGNSHLTHGCTP